MIHVDGMKVNLNLFWKIAHILYEGGGQTPR